MDKKTTYIISGIALIAIIGYFISKNNKKKDTAVNEDMSRATQSKTCPEGMKLIQVQCIQAPCEPQCTPENAFDFLNK